MIIGFHDTRDELNALHAGFGDNATNYLSFARQNDIALSHGLHDPHMDKTLRPQSSQRCPPPQNIPNGISPIRCCCFAIRR